MENLFAFSPLALAVIPVTTGVVEVLKQAGLPTRFAPLLSIITGMALVSLTGVTPDIAFAQGIVVGLASSGLFSGARATLQG